MQRFLSIVILVLFFIWILPLGAFIKPNQEKKACHGRRAICLCSHLIAKQLAKMADKVLLKQGHSSTEKESSGSPENSFTITAMIKQPKHLNSFLFFHKQ
ncbi:MAG: hypothetical protein KC733_05355, partial [Candidatus Omnitrophica bacterium]|nr:hypothetical protein [Candidatus Omnitrophota bacterium]